MRKPITFSILAVAIPLTPACQHSVQPPFQSNRIASSRIDSKAPSLKRTDSLERIGLVSVGLIRDKDIAKVSNYLKKRSIRAAFLTDLGTAMILVDKKDTSRAMSVFSSYAKHNLDWFR
jgi:hypothetical protein